MVHAQDVLALGRTRAFESRDQGFALEGIRRLCARHFAERLGEVDRMDDEIVSLSIGLRYSWPSNDQGDPGDIVIHYIMLVNHPVCSAHVAVVAGVDDDCIVCDAERFECMEDSSDLLVEQRDFAQVSSHERRPFFPSPSI